LFLLESSWRVEFVFGTASALCSGDQRIGSPLAILCSTSIAAFDLAKQERRFVSKPTN